MKTLLATIALVAGVTGCAPVYASDWWYVGGSDKMLAFVDLSTMSVAQTKVTYWVQYIDKIPSNGVKVVKGRSIVSCTTNTTDSIQSVSYGPDGSVVKSSNFAPSSNPPGVVPGSIGESEKNFVCAAPAARLKLGTKTVDPEQFAKLSFEGETPPK